MEEQPVQEQQVSDEDDGVSELLPGATAMREHFRGRTRRPASPAPEPQRKAKKPKLDVIKEARQLREAEDRAAMARREEEEAAIVDGMDLSRLQNLAIIEELPIPERPKQRRLSNDHGDRWDERWNGRKNFKKFRRKGEGGVQHRIQAVIVPLEEAKKKDFGISDEYWRFNSSTRTDRNQSVMQESNDTILASQPVSQTPASATTNTTTATTTTTTTTTARSRPSKRSRTQESDSDDDGTRFRFRRKKQR